MSEEPGVIRRVLGGFWNVLTRVRLALSNLLFLLVIVLVILLFSGRTPEPLPVQAALVLNPVGNLKTLATGAVIARRHRFVGNKEIVKP